MFCILLLLGECECSSCLLEGSLTTDFQFLVFSQIRFPHGPEYPIGAISNFYKKSRMYSNKMVNLVSTTPAINDSNFDTESFSIYCLEAAKNVNIKVYAG
jgi:hypothetical protein